MLNCTLHPDRPGVGRTDPLAGPRFHCAECWAALPRQIFRPRWLDPATPAWERGALTGERDAANSV